MNQIEIATQIFCSGKAETLELAYSMAEDLLNLDKPKGVDLVALGERFDALHEEMDLEAIEAHKERTAIRTQQLINLGFEWDEQEFHFTNGDYNCLLSFIENYDDEDWKSMIYNFTNTDDIVSKKQETVKEISDKPISLKEALSVIFGGELYKEFHMEKSTLRLFKIDDRVQAEDDLQVTKKSESKHIIAYSDNEEIGLGFTIYKK